MEEREGIPGQLGEATSSQAMGGAWASRGQRAPLAVGPTASLTARPSGLTACCLSRALPRFFNRILGIRTLILNPFLNYEL